jgi:hypothetical protein
VIAIEAGVDTTRFLYRLHDEGQQAAATAMWSGRPGKLGPLAVGYMPAHELLWVEGRPRTLWPGDTTALLDPEALPEADGRVLERLRDVGATDARSVGLSRLDATVTLRFDSPAAGWAALRGMAALDVPRRKPDVIGRPPETVYWITPAGARRERAYDKGLQTGTAAPGTLVRLEAQTRHRATDRTTAEWWNMERVRETFGSRFGTMGRAADGLHVASETTIREQLRELVEAERITAGMAEKLIGFIGAQSVGLPAPSRPTYFRRRAELRRLGLAQALDGIDGGDDLDVDLGEVLAEALTAECWRA